MKPNYTHEDVLTTDMFWHDGVLYWRIYLTDGHVCEVSDEEMRKWLIRNGELNSRKISYRKMAKYAISNKKIDKQVYCHYEIHNNITKLANIENIPKYHECIEINGDV